jgi:hypothetical protein
MQFESVHDDLRCGEFDLELGVFKIVAGEDQDGLSAIQSAIPESASITAQIAKQDLASLTCNLASSTCNSLGSRSFTRHSKQPPGNSRRFETPPQPKNVRPPGGGLGG